MTSLTIKSVFLPHESAVVCRATATDNGNKASGSLLASADDDSHANRLANTNTTTTL